MDFLEGAKQALVKVGVPFLANALLPGSGGLASSLASKALGCEDTPQAIQQAVASATPEQINALKEIEMQHQERLIELATENEKIYLQDRQNARSREMAIVQATGGKDWYLYGLATVIVGGFFALVYIMMTVKIPQESIGAINQLFGFLGAGFMGVIGYFFGSSKSSSDKTALMASKEKRQGQG